MAACVAPGLQSEIEVMNQSTLLYIPVVMMKYYNSLWRMLLEFSLSEYQCRVPNVKRSFDERIMYLIDMSRTWKLRRLELKTNWIFQ